MSGPPELPELIAASVWRRFIALSLIVISRFLPEMIPLVTVSISSNPSGLPIATTDSPSFRLSLSPNSAAVSSSASILRTAISQSVSYPTISAS